MPEKQNLEYSNSTQPLRVLHVVLNLDIGGGQEAVRTLVEYQAAAGCVPVVGTFSDGPLRQEIERLGITVEMLPPRRCSIVAFPLFVADMLRIWRSLAKLVKQYDIDVVQTHLLQRLDFLVLLLRYTTRPCAILWTVQNSNFMSTKAQLGKHKWLLRPERYVYRQLYRFGSRIASGFVAVSDQVKEAIVEMLGPIEDRIFVICNAVDVKRYGHPVDRERVRSQLGLETNATLIAVVATLKEQKGHRYMLEAMSAIVPRCPDVHALFIGDGVLREELQNQTNRLNLEGHVHFLGSRHDVPDLLAASDLFVLPSLWEGLSVALLEAMATGLPIVATEVSGTVQAIIPNKTGILVPPGDATKLAEAIRLLLSDPERSRAMGAAAKQRVEAEFSASKQADEHLRLYRRLLSK